MGKYSPLKEFLVEQRKNHVQMTFSEIETVLGIDLPASKQYPAWWSNNPSNNPMTKEWLAAGFETESVNTASGRLVFRRVRDGVPVDESIPVEIARGPDGKRPLHPGIGFMKGLITFEAGFDPSGPFSDEKWDEGYLGSDQVEVDRGDLRK